MKGDNGRTLKSPGYMLPLLRVARRRCDERWWSGGAIGVGIGVGSAHVVDVFVIILFYCQILK